MPNCLLLDDTLDVLPWARQVLWPHSQKILNPCTLIQIPWVFQTQHIAPIAARSLDSDPALVELKELQAGLADTQPVGSLISACKTVDQVIGPLP